MFKLIATISFVCFGLLGCRQPPAPVEDAGASGPSEEVTATPVAVEPVVQTVEQ